MESVKDERSLGSSGLATVGSKEPLFFTSPVNAWRAREGEEREKRWGKGKEKEVILVKDELLAWQLSLIGLF